MYAWRRIGVARHGVRVALDHEDRHQVVGGPSAAVRPHIDEKPLFAVRRGVEVALELLEGGDVHALDMQVAEAVARQLVGEATAFAHPFLVTKPAQLAKVDRRDDHGPLHTVAPSHGDRGRPINSIHEEAEDVGRLRDLASVDGE
ncbi:MAG: hypothetical protein P8Y93_10115 [Acidobacteriota bacterium]